jgi:hypothetical protein
VRGMGLTRRAVLAQIPGDPGWLPGQAQAYSPLSPYAVHKHPSISRPLFSGSEPRVPAATAAHPQVAMPLLLPKLPDGWRYPESSSGDLPPARAPLVLSVTSELEPEILVASAAWDKGDTSGKERHDMGVKGGKDGTTVGSFSPLFPPSPPSGSSPPFLATGALVDAFPPGCPHRHGGPATEGPTWDGPGGIGGGSLVTVA